MAGYAASRQQVLHVQQPSPSCVRRLLMVAMVSFRVRSASWSACCNDEFVLMTVMVAEHFVHQACSRPDQQQHCCTTCLHAYSVTPLICLVSWMQHDSQHPARCLRALALSWASCVAQSRVGLLARAIAVSFSFEYSLSRFWSRFRSPSSPSFARSSSSCSCAAHDNVTTFDGVIQRTSP